MNFDSEEDKLQNELSKLKLIYKTRGDSRIQGKQFVFISCEQKDRHLLKLLCDEISALVDCVILFAEEENVRIEKAAEISGKIDLFILCVTGNLLRSSCVDPKEEIRYAEQHGIPILPVLLEDDSDAEYQKIFSQIHYLKMFDQDLTALAFSKKLSDYLSAVLINDELFDKIRNAFDAFIFLSYRKKDRKYALELMRLIHKNSFCRNVAIWYDEYLVPGEDFSDALKKMIEKSRLFTMVVTPNLLEAGNYVMCEEYPFACSRGKDILPVLMAQTDENDLKTCFADISTPVDGRGEKLPENLKRFLGHIAAQPRAGELKHNFFIGLAYLYGIYMEKDSALGVKMISRSAEEGLPEAARKMVQLCRYGDGCAQDLNAAIDWQKKYRDLLKVQYSDIHDDGIHALIEAEHDLAELELESGRVKDARNSCWRGLYLCRSDGRGAYYSPSRVPYWAKTYMLLGDVFRQRGDEKQALECYSKDLPVFMELTEKYPEEWEILMNSCCCFFKLYDLNQRYSPWYYDALAGYLQRALKIRFDVHVYSMLAKCHKIAGSSDPRNAGAHYEQAAAICAEIVERCRSAETLSALAGAYLTLGEWCLEWKHEDDTAAYVIKAETVSRESIEEFSSMTGYLDLLKSHYLNAEIVRKREGQNAKEERSRLSQLYVGAQSVISILKKEYPGAATVLSAFKTVSVFYEFCTAEDVMGAYENAVDLVRKNPILYYKEYKNIKKTLQQQGKLDEKAYQNFEELEVLSCREHNTFFEVCNHSRDMRILFAVRGSLPAGELRRIRVPEDLLLGLRSDRQGTALFNNYHVGICSAKSEFAEYSSPDPTPEEYVYLIMDTDSGLEKVIKCCRCYG